MRPSRSKGERLTVRQVRDLNIRTMLRPETFMTWASFPVLDRALRDYFQSRFGAEVAILSNISDYIIPDRRVVDVVLFSDGGACLRQEHLWPSGLQFRLWVLSRYARGLLQEETGLPARLVAILPRAGLFPPRRPSTPFPPPEQGLRLVFSGRTDGRGKQFGAACALAAALQEESGGGEFQICGPSLIPGLVQRELARHRWKRKPRVLCDLGVDWIKKISPGVLLNLSTFVGEDFGVSVAQAQQEGWPLILSDWGGFRDVRGGNVVKLDPNLLRESEKCPPRRRRELLLDGFRKAYARIKSGARRSAVVPRGIGRRPATFIYDRHFRVRAASELKARP